MSTTGSRVGGAPTRSNAAPAQSGRKAKTEKTNDPAHTSKQIEDTIAQLERNRAGDKEQELEIEREVKKANRDLSNLLSTIDGPLSRLDTIQRKYSELLADMKRTERELVKSKKKADQLQKEKDNSRSELSKSTSQKDRLEKLCREMQKDNKKLKDENRRLGDTETHLREELHNKLEGMTTDIQEFLEYKENPENSPANMQADEMFRHKFKSFIDQYDLREVQVSQLLRQKEMEVQYQMTLCEQQRKAQEEEVNKTRQLTSQVATFSQTEAELRSQLNIYVEKFKQLYQVEDTLNNSNELFMTFRREMEEMSKKTKKLEKENAGLTRSKEAMNNSVLQMVQEREKNGEENRMLKKKVQHLESLCRGMQAQGRGGAAVPQQQAAAHAQQPQHTHAKQHLSHASHTSAHPVNGQVMAQNGSARLPEHLPDDEDDSQYEYEDEEGDSAEYEDDTEEEDPGHPALQQTASQHPATGSSGHLPEGQRALPVYSQAPAATAQTTSTSADVNRGRIDGGKAVAVNGVGT